MTDNNRHIPKTGRRPVSDEERDAMAQAIRQGTPLAAVAREGGRSLTVAWQEYRRLLAEGEVSERRCGRPRVQTKGVRGEG